MILNYESPIFIKMSEYQVFNMGGKVQTYQKTEQGYPVIEVHEFCCDGTENFSMKTMAEGHIYENNEPTTIIRNFSFHCCDHL